MARRTRIRARQIVAFHEGQHRLLTHGQIVAFHDGQHRLLTNGQIVVEDGKILYVGPEFPGAVQDELDATSQLVTPGFVNTHVHITTPASRSFRENCGNPLFYMSGIYEFLPVTWAMTREDEEACAEASLLEMLRNGSTTALVLGAFASRLEMVAEIAARLGIRLYISPGYKSANWRIAGGSRVELDFGSEEKGLAGLDRNVRLIESLDGSHGGLVKVFLGPLHCDTCSPELLRRTGDIARERGWIVQIHASQSAVEFQEIRRRTGMTPIAYLHSLGLTGPNVSFAHCLFIAGHSWTASPPERDLEILAETGTYVAHCPTVMARTGCTMETLHKFRKAGVKVTLGTDTFPQDIVQEMRVGAFAAKIREGDPRVATAANMFHMTTLEGAGLLGRSDLGRIASGCQADLNFFDLTRVNMNSHRDPLKTIVYSATGADICRTMVAGRTVVENGKVLGANEPKVAAGLDALTARLWAQLPKVDWAERDLETLSPLSLPHWTE